MPFTMPDALRDLVRTQGFGDAGAKKAPSEVFDAPKKRERDAGDKRDNLHCAFHPTYTGSNQIFS